VATGVHVLCFAVLASWLCPGHSRCCLLRLPFLTFHVWWCRDGAVDSEVPQTFTLDDGATQFPYLVMGNPNFDEVGGDAAALVSESTAVTPPRAHAEFCVPTADPLLLLLPAEVVHSEPSVPAGPV
jgi:hypothetical protein